jgi:hypothetical protein
MLYALCLLPIHLFRTAAGSVAAPVAVVVVAVVVFAVVVAVVAESFLAANCCTDCEVKEECIRK